MNERHGFTTNGQPRIYRIWRAMRFRCANAKHTSYPRYGGRGISVCKEWDASFLSFAEWAIGAGYQEDLTIDRIDNDGNYCPENCRWATTHEQTLNKSSKCLVTVDGVTKSVKGWADHTGIIFSTLYRRYHRGVRGKAFISAPVILQPKLLEAYANLAKK